MRYLSFVLVFCLLFVFGVNDAVAEDKQITSKSVSFENISILEFTNYGLEDIKIIRIWLDDFSFKSFKIQDGWRSTMASNNTITFITSEPVGTNETVKFGIKTENPNPLFNWEVLDKQEDKIESGKTQSQNMTVFYKAEENLEKDLSVILSNSTFKVIPKNLHPGSSFRVTGDNYLPNSSLKLFFDDIDLKSFETDQNGHFMFTMKIPLYMKSEEVNIILKDQEENQKTISLYISEIEEKIIETIDFTVSEIQNEFYRSDTIEFSGTANPNISVVMKIKKSDGSLFSSEIIKTDSKGDWSASVTIPHSTPIGKYSAEITDGENTLIESWDVVMSKKIQISPIKSKFNSEELITFNGTAAPDKEINIKFVNPQGNEVLTQNFIVNPSGFFKIQYPTLPSSVMGTYVLYAFQGDELEITSIGLDAYPHKTLSIQLNDVNYDSDDMAIIGMTGESLQDVTLSVMDDTDHEKIIEKIKLGPDGKRNYLLSLEQFPKGVYTMLVSTAGTQVSDVFTVDLQPSHSPIVFDMIKNTFNSGQTIHVRGTSGPYTTVDLFLIDPQGFLINQKETFVDKFGSLHQNDFIIPYGDLFGNWILRAESGLNSENFEFEVISLNDRVGVNVADILSVPVGKFVTIEGFAAKNQIVSITIIDEYENTVYQTTLKTTDSGEFDLLWHAPSKYVGKYSVIVDDSIEKVASTVFELPN